MHSEVSTKTQVCVSIVIPDLQLTNLYFKKVFDRLTELLYLQSRKKGVLLVLIAGGDTGNGYKR